MSFYLLNDQGVVEVVCHCVEDLMLTASFAAEVGWMLVNRMGAEINIVD